MRNFIYTAIILASIIFVTLSMAESSTMTFSTHVREDTVVFKTTFVLLEEAFKRVGFKFVLKTYPGKRALILSNNGETDGEAHRIYGLTNNGKYPNLVRIPEIQQIIYNYAYAIQNINLENGWEDLTPYTIAVQRGSVFLTEMANKYAKETHEISTTVQMFDFLKAGRADIVLFTPVGAHPIMDMEKFKNSKIQKIEPPLVALPIYAYLHKKHIELVPDMSKSLHEMKMDGTYQRLIKSVR